MKKSFKKITALLLTVLLVGALCLPAIAKPTEWISQSLSDIPIIRISGDGEKLIDEDGNKVFHYKDIGSVFKNDDDDGDDKETYRSIANILKPFLIQGLMFNNWDPYYENLQMENVRHHDQAWRTPDGVKYYVQDRYWFYYDWRLDPLESAAELKAYIDDILASTGCEQVGIIASCLGTNVVTAYLAVYPEHAAAHVRGVAYDGSVTMGAEMLSEAISGKFNIDAAAINRALRDCNAIGMFNVDEFVNVTLDMVADTGLLDNMLAIPKKLVYYRIVKGATSALALSTFYTWPSYWACVSPEDYDTAMEYVFGPAGSEKRTEYAGLIAKIENYNAVVRQHIPEILTGAVQSGVHFGVISKYGFQTLPICETNYLISDQFASVGRSSFGATTGTIYEDLSDEYLAARREAGFGDYLSPDGQIDASTCLFPESTWFIKGSSHSNWSDWELRLLYDIASSKEQLTVKDSCWPSRFVVYSYTNPDEDSDGEIEAMTTENCDTENWEADDSAKNANPFQKVIKAIKAWFGWLRALFDKLFRK